MRDLSCSSYETSSIQSKARERSRKSSTIVKAGHGYAFSVKSGQSFRILDTHGRQIVDMTAWVLKPDGRTIQKNHVFSADITRWNHKGATPSIGEHLFTNSGAKLFKIREDTVKVHDMTFACCYPELYVSLGLPDHRSCSANIAEAMKPWGIESHLDVRGPFNVFQNTPNYALKGGLMSSRPADCIEFEVLLDCVVAVSSCPWDQEGYGSPTDVEIVVSGSN